MNKVLLFLFISINLFVYNTTLLANSNAKSRNDIKASESFFKNGDRVCFVGNSITNRGEFHRNILLFHITRYPNNFVSFFNCGVSGDVVEGVQKRMEDDVMVNKPTHIVLMIGMNDVKRNLYSPTIITNSDTLKLREQAIESYSSNLEILIKTLLAKNLKVIVQTPTIYDQTFVCSTPNHLGVNEALKKCADIIENLALKYKLPIVDYWTLMNNLNIELQQKDASKTIVGTDRIHPGATGNFIMTYQFLKSENAPKYISKICIRKNAKQSLKNSQNCEINSVSVDSISARFSIKENALPFPAVMEQNEGLGLVPFQNEFNVELLQVNGLKSGKYKLSIDSMYIGQFSNNQLTSGINLTEFRNTPQYVQSIKVREMLNKLWEIETKLRVLKFIEYNENYKNCPNKTEFTVVSNYLTNAFKNNYPQSEFHKSQLASYLENKPFEQELKKKAELLRIDIFKLAQPIIHNFRISI